MNHYLRASLAMLLLAVPLAQNADPSGQPPASGPTSQPATQPTTAPSTQSTRRDLIVPEKDVHIPREFLDEIEQAAILAETAKLNGLDWESYFRQYIVYQRASFKWNTAEVETIALYFRAMQQMHSPDLAKQTLSPAEVEQLKTRLAEEIKRLREKMLELRRNAR